MRGGSLMLYAANRYSQNGEDGVIAEVIRRLGIKTPGTFVEFGVGDGVVMSNTLALAESGWSGVWFEQNVESCAKAKILGDSFGSIEGGILDGLDIKRIEVVYGTVGYMPEDNLDVFLDRTHLFGGCDPIFHEIDFMSIDIDSYDAQVWEAIESYLPKILLIEINSTVPIGVEQRHGNGKEGNSFTTMMGVAAKKGYTLAAHTGNLLFVKNEFAPLLRLPSGEIARPEAIFNPMWIGWGA